jgi:pimeloyl-ACP methyl ester carboxylesterase
MVLGLNIRKYGMPPYGIAVLHGGPGAPGYMAPVARELSKKRGILEPLQTRDSLAGQIDELKEQLIDHADLPVVLVGSSWGAVLALFLAARHKKLVSKLILIGSAMFDRKNSSRIEGIRLKRLSKAERKRYHELITELEDAPGKRQDELAEEWGRIFFKTDVYDPLTTDLETLEVQAVLNRKVWADFVVLKDKLGFLKREFSKINIPVAVIHGEYDPHPIEGIRPFLEECIPGIRFYILPRCGHYPWIERHARESFFQILEKEL